MVIFLYFIKGKMAQNGSHNVHKMVKNAPNELKFEPDMYFYEFYQILQDFLKIFKIGRFLTKNWPFSVYSASQNCNFFFDGKCNRAFKNAQNWLKISILLVYNARKRNTTGIFDILCFCHFMRKILVSLKITHIWYYIKSVKRTLL